MIDKIEWNHETFAVIDTLTFGEVQEFRRTIRHMIDMSKEIQNTENISPEKEIQMLAENELVTDEQMQIVANALMRCLKMDAQRLKSLHYTDVIYIFCRLFGISTTIKKNYAERSPSHISSTTPASPQ